MGAAAKEKELREINREIDVMVSSYGRRKKKTTKGRNKERKK